MQIWPGPGTPSWNESSIPLWWEQQWFKRIKDLVDHSQPDFLPASGQPDEEELAIISALTAWMAVNGEAVFATRPWKTAAEGPPAIAKASAQKAQFNESSRRTLTAEDVRFTTKGKTLYAFVMGWPDYDVTIRSLAQNTALRVGKIENVELLGSDRKLRFEQNNNDLTIWAEGQPPTKHAVVFRVMGAI